MPPRTCSDRACRRKGRGETKNVFTSIQEPTEPRFWRDDTLPFIEARSIHNGRKVSYAKHAHETFSIGIVGDGHCQCAAPRLSPGGASDPVDRVERLENRGASCRGDDRSDKPS